MKPIWYVDPGHLEWEIICRFMIDGKKAGIAERVTFEEHRRATDKNAHLAAIIAFMTARRESFIASETANHA
jgi:hypothetical protein